jgi:hypothetical protein
MRNLFLGYFSLLVFLILCGYVQSYAHTPLKKTGIQPTSFLTKVPFSESEKTLVKIAPIEVREEEEDKHESTTFGKFIECSIYFLNAQPQGGFFSIEENLPASNDSFQTSPDQYLLLRVFRI